MYSLPSTSNRCEPSPRAMKMGCPPTLRNARTGEFTPPGIFSTARRNSSSDLVCIIGCNAARAGTATEGCTIYVEIMPCMDCARAVVQAGITQVVVAAERMAQYSSEYYNEHFGMVEVLFREARVTVRRV